MKPDMVAELDDVQHCIQAECLRSTKLISYGDVL